MRSKSVVGIIKNVNHWHGAVFLKLCIHVENAACNCFYFYAEPPFHAFLNAPDMV